MTPLDQIAPAFVEMAHSIVWASVATVDRDGRPRSRILHPIWEWDGTDLFGWIATAPTPIKHADLAVHPDVSVNYWTTSQDTCTADCATQWYFDDETRIAVWDKFKNGPDPVGYDPAIIPVWKDGPTSPSFAALHLTPRRLRVVPGTAMTEGVGQVLNWRAWSETGSNRYPLHFTAEQVPPVQFFWSLTMYKLPLRIGSRTTGLRTGTDGSVHIYIQTVSPGKGKESNWLPAPAAAATRAVKPG